MKKEEKRHYKRIDSLNLIAYVCIDENNQVVSQGMGRTLNVSKGGILLETHVRIDSSNSVLLTIGLEEDLVDIKGKIVTSSQGKEEKFESGIQFFETDETSGKILSRYITAFKKQQE